MVLDVTIDPVVAQWGNVVLTWNSICTTLALVLGTLGALRRAVRAQIAPAVVGRIACWTLLGGWAGSRVLHALAHAAYYTAFPRDLLLVGDGQGSLAGALLGGALVLILAARRGAAPLAALLHVVVPPVLIGVAVYVLGNLLTGAGWGRPTGSTWGVIYWHWGALLPPDLISVPLHPLPIYQLMVSLGVLALWPVLRRRVDPAWRLGQEAR